MKGNPEQNPFIYAMTTMVPSLILALVVFILLFLSGMGNSIGYSLSALTGPLPALLIIFAVCFIPAVSPLLGPCLLIAVAATILSGEQIASGMASPFLALPAILAIDAQIGSSFIPSGFSMGENEPATINAGVPAVVFSRLITTPAAVAAACLFMT